MKIRHHGLKTGVRKPGRKNGNAAFMATTCGGYRDPNYRPRRVDPVVGCLKAISKIPDDVSAEVYWFAIGWFRRAGMSYARAEVLAGKVSDRVAAGEWPQPAPRKRRSPGRAAVTGRRLKVS